jgi:hypothetical protein
MVGLAFALCLLLLIEVVCLPPRSNAQAGGKVVFVDDVNGK